jgi:hypothetical protein
MLQACIAAAVGAIGQCLRPSMNERVRCSALEFAAGPGVYCSAEQLPMDVGGEPGRVKGRCVRGWCVWAVM